MAASTGVFATNQKPVSILFNGTSSTKLLWATSSGGYKTVTSTGRVVSVVIDILENTSAMHHVVSGWTIIRNAVVTDLNLDATQGTGAIVYSAEEAVAAITGPRGSYCPDIPVPTYLESFQTDPIGANAAKVKITYKGYPLPTIEFDGTLAQVETNIDANGIPITVKYKFPKTYVYEERFRGIEVTQSCLAPVLVPEPVFTVRWLITSWGVTGEANGYPTYTIAYLKWLFEGKVNRSEFGIGYLLSGPRTWLCEKVNGVSRDGGITYEAAMTFHQRKQTWDVPVTFVDPHDGLPPADIVNGVGRKLVGVLPQADFPFIMFGPN